MRIFLERRKTDGQEPPVSRILIFPMPSGSNSLFSTGEGSEIVLEPLHAHEFSALVSNFYACHLKCSTRQTSIPELLRDLKVNGISDEEDSNESRYLGQNSIAAFLSEETKAGQPSGDGEQDVIRKDIMPILGLQISSAPYPFMSKDHMERIKDDIAAALPSDRDVLK